MQPRADPPADAGRDRGRDVTVAFRRWDRPRVRPGTRLRTAVGVLEVGAVTEVATATLTEADARAAGHADLAACAARPDCAARARSSGSRCGWPDRIRGSRCGTEPSSRRRERAELDRRLARLDRASRAGRGRRGCSS